MKALSLVAVATTAMAPAARADIPVYTIVDLGVVGAGTASQATGISSEGGIAGLPG